MSGARLAGEEIVAEEFELSSMSLDRRTLLRRGAIGGAGAMLLALDHARDNLFEIADETPTVQGAAV